MDTATLSFTKKQSIVDEAYKNGMVSNALLLLTMDDQQFSYAVLDRSRNKLVVLSDYHLHAESTLVSPEAWIKQIMLNDEILQELKPEKVVLSMHTDCAVLIPSPLFLEGAATDMLQLACSIPANHAVCSERLRLNEVFMVYSIPSIVQRQAPQWFGDVQIMHAATSFIDNRLLSNKHDPETIVSVNIRLQRMDVLVTAGSDIRFFNSFVIQSSEDFIYYLLFVLEQLNLNPDSVPVHLFGEISRSSSHYMVSRKYIRHVGFGERPEGIEYPYGFEIIPAHQHYILFSQQICVS